NAVVIAMASRALPPKQQKQAILFGSFGAIILRVILTFFAVMLLELPYLKVIGAVLLLWIGIGLLKNEDEEEHLQDNASLGAAIKTILIADLVMSLDNVIAVAAAAGGSTTLLIIGLAISIPLVIFGATMLLKLMERWPIIITIGAALLGFVAGEMAWEDNAVKAFTSQYPPAAKYVIAAVGAAFVILMGRYFAGKSLKRATAEHLEHMGAEPDAAAKAPPSNQQAR
ncbi:MAG TPA: TerC family protein, partial [Thiobacillaceae bacterium]